MAGNGQGGFVCFSDEIRPTHFYGFRLEKQSKINDYAPAVPERTSENGCWKKSHFLIFYQAFANPKIATGLLPLPRLGDLILLREFVGGG